MSLFFRNLFFTLLQPGIAVGLFPYWIIGNLRIKQTFERSFQFNHYAGIVIFLIGLIILLECIIRFPREGKGEKMVMSL